MKLAGSTWGASANTLRSSALAFCYSAAEYCAPVWPNCSHKSGRCAVELYHASHFWHPPFQCALTLNHQPYEGRLPLTSWWRNLSNLTVGQSSLISLTHHYYNLYPVNRCGWTCNQLTSKVDGGITGSWLRKSTLVCDPTIRQPDFDLPRQQWSLLNWFYMEHGHCGACRRKW